VPIPRCRPEPRYSVGSPATWEFRQLYLLARQCQAEDLADEILKIADDSSRDYKKKIGAD
jgi:hypothetical protein